VLSLLLGGIIAASTAPAQVAVIPFQRTQALSPDDSLLLQEVVSGLIDDSPRFQLVPVSLEDLMAGRVPQFVIAGALRRTQSGTFELELNLQVKGQTQAVSATVRQGPDLPALAAALDDVLPSLFGEPATAAATKTVAPSTSAPSTVTRGFFAKPWQPYSAAGGGVLIVVGGALNYIAYSEILDLQEQHKSLDNIAEPTDSERAKQESLRTEHNNSVERFKAVDLPVSLTLILSGAVLGIASLSP
jgi:hypothetical protein